MLEDYIIAGFDPAAFWGLSLRLYLAQMKAANSRQRLAHQNNEWLAWHVAALQRTTEFPDFEDFSRPASDPASEQSPEEVQIMFNALAAVWGAKGPE
jgi:hypothetical protein